MTSDQKKVVAAVTKTPSATTIEAIESQVSSETGIEVPEVRRILAYLVNEGLLNRCVTPSRNVLEEPEPRPGPTRVRYELDQK